MLAVSTTLAAAAYLLLAQPGHTGQPVQITLPRPCQLTMNMNPAPAPPHNHLSVRWVGDRHHHHHRHLRRSHAR